MSPAPRPGCGILPRPHGAASLEKMWGVSRLSRSREAPDVLVSACCLPNPFLLPWVPSLSSLHPSQSCVVFFLGHSLFWKVFRDTPPGAMLGVGLPPLQEPGPFLWAGSGCPPSVPSTPGQASGSPHCNASATAGQPATMGTDYHLLSGYLERNHFPFLCLVFFLSHGDQSTCSLGLSAVEDSIHIHSL